MKRLFQGKQNKTKLYNEKEKYQEEQQEMNTSIPNSDQKRMLITLLKLYSSVPTDLFL